MTGSTILANCFFGFWYILGEYYIAIWGVALFATILISIYYLLVKR
jgi:hypothetical protein